MVASTSGYFRRSIDNDETIATTIATHREAVRHSSFPPPKDRAPKTFLHGFLLPFSLILATLRQQNLGLSYLKITVVRTLIVGMLAALALRGSDRNRNRDAETTTTTPHAAEARRDQSKGVHLHTASFNIDLDRKKGQQTVNLLGHDVPVTEAAKKSANDQSGDQSQPTNPIVAALSSSWAWLVWFIGIISATEGFVVFFSRRYDDWLGYWAAPLARVKPEDPFPKAPKVAIDIKWLFKKLKRRIRGYIVFGAGIPLIAVFKLIPGLAGNILFSVGLTMWGWYWLAVFTAAKSSHAWADDKVAPSPLLIREIRDRSSGRWWLSPFRLYGRLWGWLTQGVNSPAAMFERNPAPFLGMALARFILSLPGLYLLARPIVPIAASRLIAESDPQERFSL